MEQGAQARNLELENQARWVAGVTSWACVTGWAGLAGQPGPRPIPGNWTFQAADPYLSLLSHLYLAWGLPHLPSDSLTWAFSKPLPWSLCEVGSKYQFSSVTQSCPTLCNPMNCSMPDLPVHHQFLEFTQTHVHWVSDAIQPSHPLWSPSPPTFSLSQDQGLFNESVLRIRWPKYWSFSFNISPSNEHPGLISFRMDWLDQ